MEQEAVKAPTKLEQRLKQVPKGEFAAVTRKLKRMGVLPSNVWHHARRGNRNRGETLIKFAQAIGCEVKDILDDLDTPAP